MRAVFLDRDGVINENRPDHVKCWDEFRFLPGVLTAIRWLRLAGFHVFVVTNQAIIARGAATHGVVEDIHRRMMLQVALHGGRIHDIRYCPHDADDACRCRKPQPGMLLDIAAHWSVDLGRSYLIGDALSDMAAGASAGCRTVLVRTGRGGEQCALPEARQTPIDYVAVDLPDAVDWLFRREGLTLPRQDLLPRPALAAVGSLIALPVAG
jgi:D-glycero-D-manno-heptose 1,7-bisphosphate phosphatase